MIHRTFIANRNNSCEHVTILYYYRVSVSVLCASRSSEFHGYSFERWVIVTDTAPTKGGIVMPPRRRQNRSALRSGSSTYRFFENEGHSTRWIFIRIRTSWVALEDYLLRGHFGPGIEIEEKTARERPLISRFRTFGLSILRAHQVEYRFYRSKRVEVNYFRVGGWEGVGGGREGGRSKMHLKWKRGYENVRSAIEEKN